MTGPKKALVTTPGHPYTGRRSGGRVVEGTPLLRVQAGNRLEGSNPFHSAILSISQHMIPPQLRRVNFLQVAGTCPAFGGCSLSQYLVADPADAGVSTSFK